MRWLLLLVPLLMMGEPLTKAKIIKLLDKQNPFVLLRSLEMLQSAALKKQKDAPYDLRVDLGYEKKEYPLSRALYMEGGVKKLLEKGVEVGILWRKASGIQEYNNIKTGADGEYLAQIKLHLNALLEGMSKTDIQKEQATLEVLRQKRLFSEALNNLVFEVLSLYNEAIALKRQIELVQKRLKRSEQMQKLLKRKFEVGVASKQDLLQLQEWVLSQHQAMVRLRAALKRVKRTLGLFLGIRGFELPSSFEPIVVPPLQEAIKRALAERGSVQELAIRAKQQELAYKAAKLQRLGKLDVMLYGVHDVAYEKDGAKGVVRFSMPLQRTGYRAKSELAKIGQMDVRTRQVLLERTIKTDLANLYSDLEGLKQEESVVGQRVMLLEQIQALESQKFKEGVSDFFTFNQKVLQLFRAKEELLQIEKKIVLKQLHIKKEMGSIGRD